MYYRSALMLELTIVQLLPRLLSGAGSNDIHPNFLACIIKCCRFAQAYDSVLGGNLRIESLVMFASARPLHE
jgi:hypothetical protein